MRQKLLGLALLLLAWLPASGAYAANLVPVTLPAFEVTLGGQTITPTYSRYPFLVYNDITYFPMTYHDSRLLGLTSDWTKEDGLIIDKTDGYCYEYSRQINERANAKQQTAQIASGPITVNGQTIDNAAEEYPLLVFRDVTYFPLTWRFAVEAFGWDYTFDQKKGLTITNNAVKFEDPEPWQGEVGYSAAGGAGSMAGADDIRFPIRALPRYQTISLRQLNDPAAHSFFVDPGQLMISVHNYGSAAAVDIQPMTQWEYRLTRERSGQQELLYWRKIPFFSGALKDGSNIAFSQYYTIPFWQSDEIKPGTYHITLLHPEALLYTENDSATIQSTPIIEAPESYGQNGSTINLFFSETITITQ